MTRGKARLLTGMLVALAAATAALGAGGCDRDAGPSVEEVKAQASALTAPSNSGWTLPQSGTAQFSESDDGGATFTSLQATFMAKAQHVDVDVVASWGALFTSTLQPSGLQPDADSSVSPLTLYLDTLPNRGSSVQQGDVWETLLPSAYLGRIQDARNNGTSSYHTERTVQVADIFTLSPEIAIVRVTFTEHVTRTSSLAIEDQGLASGRLFAKRVGVADVAVGTAGSFSGHFLPVRLAAIAPEPAEALPANTSYAAVEAAAHSSVLSCATSMTGLPSVALSTIPSGGTLPLPALFTQCP